MRSQALIVLTFLLASPGTPGSSDQALTFEFTAAEATILPRASNRPIELPELRFVVRAQAFCPSPQVPASISVSIADTRMTITPADEAVFEHEILVPAKQLAPVVATGFCLADDPGSMQEIRLESALSAQLSLRCNGENSESISYATAGLDVALLCENPEPLKPEAAYGEDASDASATSSLRLRKSSVFNQASSAASAS